MLSMMKSCLYIQVLKDISINIQTTIIRTEAHSLGDPIASSRKVCLATKVRVTYKITDFK